MLLDSTQINNEYATRSYVRTLYHSNISESEKNKNQNEYRKYKESFKDTILSVLNNRISDYSFTVKTNSKSNLETDLTIKEGDIEIENKGKGRQCFIKTDFALRKNENELDLILLEEPENHLSHINMKRLIQKIYDSDQKQIILATHSNLISSRLDLRKAKLLNSNSDKPISLNDLNDETSKFFMKAPDNNILEYIMSKKVILVEGAAEYILFEKFFESETGMKLEDSDIHLISVGGTSFKRYLDLGILLGIRTAVIRDNDGDYEKNITEAFQDYCNDYINVFADIDKENWTFEVALYKKNSELCEDLFSEGRRSLSVQDYMLSNKADCAFELLKERGDDILIPYYIEEALQWIRA